MEKDGTEVQHERHPSWRKGEEEESMETNSLNTSYAGL